MATTNARISGRSAGARAVRIIEINHGLEIIASGESEGRSRKAYYPLVVDDSAFTIRLVWVSWAEREDFNRWMANFMNKTSEGNAKYGTLTVACPSRKFTRVGVPQGDLQYGEGVGDVTYTADISFVAAEDPVNVNLKDKEAGISRFKGPGGMGQSFYPAGNQLKGAGSLDEFLFDYAADDPGFAFDYTTDGPPKGAV